MDPPTTLCPGYRQVESFGPDEEYEDEEEEVFYVTLDMGNVEPTLVPSSTSYRLIGLDTPTPYIQLQGTILKGRHDQLLGTEMIFTDDKESHDWNTRSVIHVGNTEQRIAFQEVTLIPKIPTSTSTSTSTGAPATVEGGGEGGEVSTSTSKPHEITVNLEPPPPTHEERSVQIDRMTGVCGPPTRASRSRKSSGRSKAATSKRKGKGKEKEKEKETDKDMDMEDTLGPTPTTSMVTRQRKAKAKDKGKEKEKEKETEVPQPSDDVSPMDEDQDADADGDDDDMDDMYMDE